MNNRPPVAVQPSQTPTPNGNPPKTNGGQEGASLAQQTPKFNPLTYQPPVTNQKQTMEPLLPNNQSMKSTQQAPQLKQPVYAGLPTNLLAPYSEGSLEANIANAKRMSEQGYEMRMVYDEQNKRWTSQYVMGDTTGGIQTSPTDTQRQELLTIYDSMLLEQQKEYQKLLTDLPTMAENILEVLVINRERYPYEIRQAILDEYKTRINYHDRLRNPQNYLGQQSPLFPQQGTYLSPDIE